MGKFIDLSGQHFGKLIVIERAPKPDGSHSTSAFWLCQCECGTKKIISSAVLRAGKAKSCGCLNYELRDKDSLINQRFGKLTVISRAEKPEFNKGKDAYWKCKCDCGKEKIIMGKSLKNGSTRSCGCLQSENGANKIVGKRFGKLTVIKQTDSRTPSGVRYYECKCDCGNIHLATAGSLQNGAVSSCGCLRSLGEYNIENLLNKYNINYKKEVSFGDLLSEEKKAPLRFDFGIYNKEKLLFLIEFQGEQHYVDNPIWDSYPKERDEQKKEYCKNNNIPLVIIPYWHRHSLTIEKIIPQDFQYLLNYKKVEE